MQICIEILKERIANLTGKVGNMDGQYHSLRDFNNIHRKTTNGYTPKTLWE